MPPRSRTLTPRALRTTVSALVLVVVAVLGVFAPAATAATGGPRVVIIVGATHGATSSYRAKADKAYAEARKYTTNVVKVYSPNATWSKVKSATKGASIVVYFGHGNGWPSPYTYDPKYTTKDGFGLNASAGNGDSNNKYYGEPYVSTLDLAPNAVVILSNLCYASGNSEPGDSAPSVSTARKRVDNYAAGFLKAADAVIADGHGSPEPYIRGLFTTHATIEQVWRSAPNFHDHVKAFASSRTPGATAYTDTDSTTSGYYRSLVWRKGLTTDEVTGATHADTGIDPATLVVPGNATVGAADASLYGADGQPTGTVPAGARLRVVEQGNTIAATGTTGARVEGLDDPSISGWMAVGDLVPRDSAAPAVWGLDTSGGVLSPNGDGRFDDATVTGRFSEAVDWRVRVLDGGDVLREETGSGDDFSLTWDGLSGGSALPDGTYDVSIRADDPWGNGPTTRTTTLRVDTAGAELGAVSNADEPDRWFSPNGDTSRETVSWTASMSEPGSLVLRILDGDSTEIFKVTRSSGTGSNSLTWDGKDGDGNVVPDGQYEARITPRDATGTNGETLGRPVRVDTTLGDVTAFKSLFYPSDGDTLARTTALRFTLTRPSTVTMTVRNAAGDVVASLAEDEAMPVGTTTRTFDGRSASGAWLPRGRYTALVSASDGTTTVSQSTTFEMNAFAIKLSDTTPGRGQRITVYATSAEPLSSTPRLYVKQPGKSTWSAAMTKTSTYGYRVTITLKTGAGSGIAAFTVSAVDKYGKRQLTKVTYKIH